jgi:hypothetical protein
VAKATWIGWGCWRGSDIGVGGLRVHVESLLPQGEGQDEGINNGLCATRVDLGGGFRRPTPVVRAVARCIGSGFRPRTTCYFLLRGQKKLTKEKAAPMSRRYRGPLRYSPGAGSSDSTSLC